MILNQALQTYMNNDLSTPARRLRHIRNLARITRGYIQQKYRLADATLKSWEKEERNITAVAAERCAQIYLQEGIIVSPEWILYGQGLPPTNAATVGAYFNSTEEVLDETNDEICMLRDADVFKKLYPNGMVLLVSNSDMSPFYKAGDYVGGGILYQGSNIERAVNKDCIVLLKTGEQFFRRLIKTSKGTYNLVCLNPSEETAEPVLYDADVAAVAPIIWHRLKGE